MRFVIACLILCAGGCGSKYLTDGETVYASDFKYLVAHTEATVTTPKGLTATVKTDERVDAEGIKATGDAFEENIAAIGNIVSGFGLKVAPMGRGLNPTPIPPRLLSIQRNLNRVGLDLVPIAVQPPPFQPPAAPPPVVQPPVVQPPPAVPPPAK